MWREILFELGDLNIYLILMSVIAFVGVVILIERGFFLIIVQRLDFARFTHELIGMLKARDYERAQAYCKQHKSSEFAALASSALEKHQSDPSAVSVEIKQRLFNFLPRISARLTMVPGIASTILLLGIIASLHSLWDAVQAAKTVSLVNPSNIIQLGLSRCLSPTAFGLLLAMFLIIGHQLILGVSTRLSHMIQSGSEILNDLLAPKTNVRYVAQSSNGAQNVGSLDTDVDAIESALKEIEKVNATEEII